MQVRLKPPEKMGGVESFGKIPKSGTGWGEYVKAGTFIRGLSNLRPTSTLKGTVHSPISSSIFLIRHDCLLCVLFHSVLLTVSAVI